MRCSPKVRGERKEGEYKCDNKCKYWYRCQKELNPFKIKMEQIWSLEKIWNDTIIASQHPLKRRNHIHAGEIGKNFYERYLKMSAIEPEKGFEDRVLRKFSAGLWFEEQVGHILKTVGILKMAQEPLEIPEDADHLRVSGRLDFMAGGINDWNEARARVEKEDFPDFTKDVSLRMIDHFEKEYPKGLEDVVLEIKSVNSQVFWAKKDYLMEAYPHHTMQLYTYLKALNKPLGKLIYISKDDLTIKEIEVHYPDKELDEVWEKDVRLMTKFWREQQEPLPPPSVVFDKRKKLRFQHEREKLVIIGCYTDNWEVKWSNYFERMTGCKTEKEWLRQIQPLQSELNKQIKDKYLLEKK